MLTLDTETCGLHGVAVLIQYAEDNLPIQMHSIWTEPISKTMQLIEWICSKEVLGFNLVFDWFHIQKLYCMLHLCKDKDHPPIIDEMTDLESAARDIDLCLKPHGALDLFLYAKKGPYQTLMERNDIRIKKVPNALAFKLAEALETLVNIPDIYFARRKKQIEKWKVEDTDDIDFKNIVLRFAPTSALKALCVDALGLMADDVLYFSDVSLSKKSYPDELGYCPLAYGEGWPTKIKEHIIHWGYNEIARKYAAKDVELTRNLYYKFDSPPFNDYNSLLACAIASIRWRGFRIDETKLKNLRNNAISRSVGIPVAPSSVKTWLTQVMDPVEQIGFTDTKKTTLQEISNWDGEIGRRARSVLEARSALKEVELFDKLLKAGRFHASFKIIGTLSDRMSGADDLNPQGIKHTREVRSCFPLAWPGQILTGGDFVSFEVVLADAVYNDPDLRADLQSGKKIHALFGQHVFKDKTYEEILNNKELYSKSKQAVFAMLYGGEASTLKDRLGVSLEIAEEAYRGFINRYKKVGFERRKVFNMMCSMSQPDGIGTRVIWREPSDFIESMFSFKRYFTLENRICKTLFNLAEAPPSDWLSLKAKVTRRDRVQTVVGATRSALFGAAFAIQAQNMRSAANHVIQSTGATLTKILQTRIWGIQPPGISKWLVMPLNEHDELNVPCNPSVLPDILKIKDDFINEYKKIVPLLEIDWKERMETWADKT